MPDTVAIPLQCHHCGAAVILQVANWPMSLLPEPLEPREVPAALRRRWECPHCKVENETGLPGQLVWARKAGDPGPD